MKNKYLICSLALLAFVVFSGPANATPLPPGSPPTAPDNLTGDLVGATELANATTNFVTTIGTVNGTISASVFSDPLNVFGAGRLTFVYQITNNASSTENIVRGSASSFAGFPNLDVGFSSLGGAIPGGHFVNGIVGPGTVDNLQMTGSTIGFNFGIVSILAGQTSFALIIQTPATSFVPGNFSIIDGGVATVPAFQPSVPDGGSAVALLGIALAGLEGVRRMFRARKS